METIRLTRNQLCHASSACLDEQSFNSFWTNVTTATLDLAQSISQEAFDEANDKIKKLKSRMMDPSELIVLRQTMLDQGTVEEIKEEIEDTKIRLETLEKTITSASEASIVPEEKVNQLRDTLIERYFAKASKVQVSPLPKTQKGIDIDKIFVPVIMKEIPMGSDEHGLHGLHQINSPLELFYKDEKPVKNIFIQGEAARGKSVYCRKLLQSWCKAKQAGKDVDELTVWEKCLAKFDFAFLVALRHVNRKRVDLIEMVCCDVLGRNKECHETVYHVLASEKYRCLILVDGLDEWRIPENLREILVHNFLPNVENVSNCTFLYTFRPWILASIANAIDESDRLVQIEGLDERGREEVIGNVLERYYGMGKTSIEFQQKKRAMVERSNNEIFKSLMDIPLLITASVILWSKGEHVGKSMTSFYVSLVQLLIKRAKGARVLSSDTIRKVEDRDSSDLKHPNLFSLKHNFTMKTFLGILSRLGKMAYTDLLSEETHLVFGKEELDEHLNESELDFSLRTGILSQSEAPGTFDRENVSVSFFHTTIQEFLAAVHVVCQQDADINSFLSELNATEKMLRLSNLIIFISGLSPTDGYILSRYISSAVSDDPEMIEYREDFTSSHHKAEMIYNMQVDCYRERHCESDEDVQSLQYHVQDVHIQTTNKTRTYFKSLILLRQFGELRSLFLIFVPCFMNEQLKALYDALHEFLLKIPSLEALAILRNGVLRQRAKTFL